MIIFSDTTPIIALAGINKLHLLPALFGIVHVVDAVVEECAAGGKVFVPDLAGLSWIKIASSTECTNTNEVAELDKGEKYTILMALRMKADCVIIDERIGRNIAEYMGLSVTGTLGILLKAKQKGKIDSFSDCVIAMQKNGIHYHTKLVEKLALLAGEII